LLRSFFLLLALAALLLSLWRGSESVLAGGGDIGWLIATGEYILARGHLPGLDIFTWTSTDRPFICYQWLFEVFAAGLYRSGGLFAVAASAFLVTSYLALYALPAQWQRRGLPRALAFALLAPALTPFWFFARPQLVTYLAAYFFISILERWRNDATSGSIYVLPAIVLLWTNMHCFGALGPSLIAVYLAFCGSGRSRSLQFVLLASLVALFITPFDAPTILQSLNIFIHTDPASCNELQPLYLTRLLFDPANIYVLAALTLLLAKRKNLPAVGLAISLAALMAGLGVARLQPLAVILSWPFVGLALAAVYRPGRADFKGASPERPEDFSKGRRRVWPTAWMGAALALSMLIWCGRYRSETEVRRAFLGGPETLQFVASHLKGDNHLFNDTISGSRLIFLHGPAVYIDSRLFLFTQTFYNDWLQAMNGPSVDDQNRISWPAFAARRGIDAVVLTRGLALYQTLLAAPDWLLVVDDGESSFWLADNASNRSKLQSWGVDCDRGTSFGLSGSALAVDEIAQAAKHLARARAYLDGGAFGEARKQGQAALNLVQSKGTKDLIERLDALENETGRRSGRRSGTPTGAPSP
jgi:hypothetical protein